jgi:putative Mg2+ transporter-C (MgtC) family protein
MSQALLAGDIILRLAVALLAGAAIGVERQLHQKMAGLRTNALVSLGAAGFVAFQAALGQGDPTRIAAQVVSGIGFLGAGVILREGLNVRGLNTAATLWCSAMVGTFAGGGFYGLSLAAAGFVVGTNLVMKPVILGLERNRHKLISESNASYSITVTCREAEEAHVRSVLLHALSQAGLGLSRLESENLPDVGRVCVVAETVAVPRQDTALEQIAGRLSLEPFITAVSWEVGRTNGES